MQFQRVAARVLLAAGLCVPATPCFSQVDSALPQGEFRISTNVDRVVLPVTVVRRGDKVVANLTKESFRVFEDGRPQEIRGFFYRDIPLTVGLVMDSSSSMAPKRSTAILAALHFLQLSNPQDEAFVVDFNEKVRFGLPQSAPFSANPEELRAALMGLPCQGRTALYDAVVAAAEHLSRGTREKKALIVVSDGGDNASRHRLEETIEAVERSNAIVFAIGVFDPDDEDRNPKVLKQLARPTGGEAFFPQDPRELPGILAHIAQVLRSQYTITFAPASNAEDGGFHRVQVIATEPGGTRRLPLRTRAGYYARARAAAASE